MYFWPCQQVGGLGSGLRGPKIPLFTFLPESSVGFSIRSHLIRDVKLIFSNTLFILENSILKKNYKHPNTKLCLRLFSGTQLQSHSHCATDTEREKKPSEMRAKKGRERENKASVTNHGEMQPKTLLDGPIPREFSSLSLFSLSLRSYSKIATTITSLK